MTIVRSTTHRLVGPHRVPVVFIERDWLYHVTGTSIARLMKINGIQSAYVRTGRREPDPNGSFALDKVSRIGKVRVERLKYYFCLCLLNGWSAEADMPYIPFMHVATGSNDDYISLDAEQQKALCVFAKSDKFKTGPLKPVKEKAELLAITHQNRSDLYLWKLANQYAEFYFNVEGAITSSHIYFLNTVDLKDMMSGFRDYIKFRQSYSIAVLRVRRSDVIGLEQDMADFRALRTQLSVTPDKLEILVGIHTDFLRDPIRGAEESWMPLQDWT